MRRQSFLLLPFLLLVLAACTSLPAPATAPPSVPSATPSAAPIDEDLPASADTTGTPQLIEFYADW